MTTAPGTWLAFDNAGHGAHVPAPPTEAEAKVIAILNAMPRPRGVPAGARVLSIDLDRDTASWSSGHVKSIIPPNYVTA